MGRAGVLLTMAIALVAAFTLRQPVDPNSVHDSTVLHAWWTTWSWASIVAGSFIGALGGELALRRMRYSHAEVPARFAARIRLTGVAVSFSAVLLTVLIASGAALLYRELANATREARWMALMVPKGVGLAGLAYMSAMLGFAVMTASREWGGQYAFVPSTFFTRNAARGA